VTPKDDFEILRLIIDGTESQAILTGQLLHEAESQEMPFEFNDLVGYWRKGKLYTSQLKHTDGGYLPTKSCTWTTRYQKDYFGFNPELGAFEINSNIINPIRVDLDASMALESAAVCIAVHPSGREFAVGTLNGTIAVYNVDQGKASRTFRANQSRVWTLAYSPDGDLLISGHQNGELVKWDRNGILLAKAITCDWVRSISFSPDGTKFLTSHRVKKEETTPSIYHWDTLTFRIVETFIHVPRTVWCVRYLPNGKGFVSGGFDQKVTLWSFEKNDVAWSEKKHTGTVTTLVVHPYGGIVASGAWTGTVKLWDVETGSEVRTIEVQSARIYGLSISPSGRILASGGKESSITLLKLPECSVINRFAAHAGWVRGLQFIDEHTLVSVGSEGICKLWRLSQSLPFSISVQPYESSQEVLNEFRRPLDSDDE